MPVPAGTDWIPEGFTIQQIGVNGTGLSVAVGGRGPALVLLHGWPQTGYAWRHVMAPLAAERTVVVPDLRGAGRSARPETGYAKTNQAQDLRELLAHLGLATPVAVAGHDIGAMVAFGWALAYPDDVSALVLLDALLPGVDLEDHMDVADGGYWHFGFFMAPGVPEMLFDGHEDEFITTTFRQLAANDVFSEQDLTHYADAYRGRDRLRGGFAQYRTLLADGQENRALLAQHGLAMPVLDVRAGAHGHTAADPRPLRAHAENLTVVAAPTGHFVAEEDPQWFIGTLNRFLSAGA